MSARASDKKAKAVKTPLTQPVLRMLLVLEHKCLCSSSNTDLLSLMLQWEYIMKLCMHVKNNVTKMSVPEHSV